MESKTQSNTYNVKSDSLFGAGILCYKNTFGIKFQVFFVVFKHFLDFASVFGNKIVLLRRNSWVGALGAPLASVSEPRQERGLSVLNKFTNH